MKKKPIVKSKSKRPGIATARPPKSAPIPAVREAESRPQHPTHSPKPVWRKDSPLIAKDGDFEVPAPQTAVTFPLKLVSIVSEAVGFYARLVAGNVDDEAESALELLGDPTATLLEASAHELKVIQKIETALKVRGDNLKAEILETLSLSGVERAQVCGLTLSLVSSFSATINAQDLLTLGVGVDVIEKAKAMGKKPYTYVKLKPAPGIEEKAMEIQSGVPK